MLALLLLACAPPDPTERPETPDTGAQDERPITLDPSARPAVVTLAPAEPDPALPRGAELSGLVTGLVELGLGELDGVTPEVPGIAVSPGLQGALHADPERWTLSTRMAEEAGLLHIHMRICTAGGTCEELESGAARAEPTPAVASLLSRLADTLGRGEDEGAEAARAEPQSLDPYAVLLAGRSAGVWYGLLPATPEALIGNKRRDPVTRALLVDPDTALGNWVAGRRALAMGQAEEARARFAAASFARPASVLLRADEAAALTAAGHAETAWYAWGQVLARRPGDPRYALPAAMAAMAAGIPGETEEILAALAEPEGALPEVLALRVDALDALGHRDEPEFDALLARWAEVAPQDPEPVRRRMLLRVRAGRYDEALTLAEALRSRGGAAPEEREAVERTVVALQSAMGRDEQAAKRAAEAGDLELAARLRARAAQDPAAQAAALAEVPGERAAARQAQALLEAGQEEEALALAETTLRASPWLPEALDAKVRALDALGRADDAAATRARLCESDPGFAGCGRIPEAP